MRSPHSYNEFKCAGPRNNALAPILNFFLTVYSVAITWVSVLFCMSFKKWNREFQKCLARRPPHTRIPRTKIMYPWTTCTIIKTARNTGLESTQGTTNIFNVINNNILQNLSIAGHVCVYLPLELFITKPKRWWFVGRNFISIRISSLFYNVATTLFNSFAVCAMCGVWLVVVAHRLRSNGRPAS